MGCSGCQRIGEATRIHNESEIGVVGYGSDCIRFHVVPEYVAGSWRFEPDTNRDLSVSDSASQIRWRWRWYGIAENSKGIRAGIHA